MEQFLVGAYIQLVEGCDVVTYNSDAPSPKMFWIEIVGRDEAKPRVFYVDFAEKFDLFPAGMRPDTMVKRLVERYVEFHRQGTLFEYAPEDIHCQVWLPRPPVARVAEALPKAAERLRRDHGISLDLIDPAEVARRVPLVVERAQKLSFDCDNLFIRALLLAQGRLDVQAGSPMGEEHIRAMYHFPRLLASASQIPRFVYQFLTSDEIVHWLDFYSPTFDDMAVWIHDVEPQAGLGELRHALEERGETDEPDFDEDFDDEDEDMDVDTVPYESRRYSARDLAELVRLTFKHVDALREAAEEHAIQNRLSIEIDFMLPFLWKAQERIEPSLLEREILRYGGDRDQMLAHFADAHPDKMPYRAILRVEFYSPADGPPPPTPHGQVMQIHLRNPALSAHTHALLHLNYASDFTGYFILVMHRLAAELEL